MEDQSPIGEAPLWRGIDLSGVTLVLGAGTGQLIRLLLEQAALVGGHVVVMAPQTSSLAQLLGALGPRGTGLTLIRGRWRAIPFVYETVDLLVVNGVLREVPLGKLGAVCEEFWRVLVPGGKLRISDIMEPSEAAYNQAWAERNGIVRKLAQALRRPTAISVDLQRAAMALRAAGFEDLALSILPGYALTDAWLEDTVNAIRMMTGRLTDHLVRDEVLGTDLGRLVSTYALGQQRAAERFVLKGTKVGDLALDMRRPSRRMTWWHPWRTRAPLDWSSSISTGAASLRLY